MKKKFSLLGLVLILVLSLVGCGSKASEEAEYDQATMEQYADTIVTSFSNMSEENLDQFADMSDLELNLTLMQSGLPIEADDFKSMIDAWKAGLDECGTISDFGDYELTVKSSSATLTVPFKGEKRDGDLEFTFDEKMNMDSITVNGHYGMAEILKKAGLNTVLGMGTVFVVLIFISFIISLFKFIPAIQNKFSKKPQAETKKEASAAAPAPVEVVPATDDSELIAVISAAIAASEGTSTDGFVVRSIKRRKSNKWS